MTDSSSIVPRDIRWSLEPYFKMIKEKEETMSSVEWLALVNSVKERIANSPEQYLTGNVKPSEELEAAIELLFKERLN